MPDNKTELPEGTDKVIGGAGSPSVSNSGAIGTGPNATGDDEGEVLIVTETEIAAVIIDDDTAVHGGAGASGPSGRASRSSGGGSSGGIQSGGSGGSESGSDGGSDGGSDSGGARGMMDKIRSGGEKISGQAGDKARDLFGQGMERSAEALANVGRMVGDTAPGIDERLGEEYGDYARRAASAIESAANRIASQDPDMLIEDGRNFVRKSPAVALAGAAVAGFVIARLVKTGLGGSEGDGERAGSSGASGGSNATSGSGGSNATGTSGGSNATGTSGRSNATGASGTSGASGSSGPSGFSGPSGPSGPRGSSDA